MHVNYESLYDQSTYAEAHSQWVKRGNLVVINENSADYEIQDVEKDYSQVEEIKNVLTLFEDRLLDRTDHEDLNTQ